VNRSTISAAGALAILALAVIGSSGCGASQGAGPPPSTPSTKASTLPGTDRPAVTIGDKNYTEQFVLGQLYMQALQARGFDVSLNRNIGPTEVSVQALQSGRIDMYPEYLGTWNTAVAGDQQQYPTVRAAFAAGQQYAQAHGLELLHWTPFSDVDAIGVTVAFAQQNGLRSIPDLAKVAAGLTLGAPPQFKTSTVGLQAIEQVYGVVPASFKPLEVGDQYKQLDQGIVQAADVNTTDGQLLSGQYKLLSDPKRLFGWGNVVPVVPAKVLANEGPQFGATIDAVTALLSTAAMRELNAAVDVYHEDPATAAKQFLLRNGLVPPS